LSLPLCVIEVTKAQKAQIQGHWENKVANERGIVLIFIHIEHALDFLAFEHFLN